MTQYSTEWPSAFDERAFAESVANALARRREFLEATSDSAGFMADMAREIVQIPEVRRAIGAAVFAGAHTGIAVLVSRLALIGLGYQWSSESLYVSAGVAGGIATAAWLVGDVARHPLQNIVAEIADQISKTDFRLPAIVYAKDADNHAAGVVGVGDKWTPVRAPDGVSAGEVVAFARLCKELPRNIAETNAPKYGVSGPKFRKLRTWALDWDFMRWRNSDNTRLGVRLTGVGHRYFDRLLGHSPTGAVER